MQARQNNFPSAGILDSRRAGPRLSLTERSHLTGPKASGFNVRFHELKLASLKIM